MTATAPRKRGRPPKSVQAFGDTREALIRSGLVLLTQHGFLTTGVDAVVKQAGVPKGSFYYYFKSKEEYGISVLDAYDRFFTHMLTKHLENDLHSPLARLSHFIADACAGMQKYAFSRGCLVGNLMQECPGLPSTFVAQLDTILGGWQARVQRCFHEAQCQGEIAQHADIKRLAAVFWSGWEGAVMRAKLASSLQPIDDFWHYFQQLLALPAPT